MSDRSVIQSSPVPAKALAAAIGLTRSLGPAPTLNGGPKITLP